MAILSPSISPVSISLSDILPSANTSTSLETQQLLGVKEDRYRTPGLYWYWGLDSDYPDLFASKGNFVKVHSAYASLFREMTWTLLPLPTTFDIIESSTADNDATKYPTQRRRLFNELDSETFEYVLAPVRPQLLPQRLYSRDGRSWLWSDYENLPRVYSSVHPAFVVAYNLHVATYRHKETPPSIARVLRFHSGMSHRWSLPHPVAFRRAVRSQPCCHQSFIPTAEKSPESTTPPETSSESGNDTSASSSLPAPSCGQKRKRPSYLPSAIKKEIRRWIRTLPKGDEASVPTPEACKSLETYGLEKFKTIEEAMKDLLRVGKDWLTIAQFSEDVELSEKTERKIKRMKWSNPIDEVSFQPLQIRSEEV
ncbi:hypothetical protein DL96DRAFT_1703085 [Flagelloscypha sp. PMI_526]|nr:hypothetical protein DL96DRAFT_1703085 [Flagelloscypha sp. PMI_526]